VVKNKVAAPFREAEFDILYNEGISREGELLDYAVEKNIVQKAGTWLSFGEERIGQGRENARLFLKEHADVRKAIEAKLLPALGMKVPESAAGTPCDADCRKAGHGTRTARCEGQRAAAAAPAAWQCGPGASITRDGRERGSQAVTHGVRMRARGAAPITRRGRAVALSWEVN
jgi:recombination protein RecA